MAQEEHTQKYSNSNSSSGGGGGGGGGGVAVCGSGGNNGGGDCGGGGRSSKKMKQKKVPQRGLGVAQLEKIRLEEQQKKDATLQEVANVMSPSNSSSCLAVQCPPPTSFRPTSISSCSSVPLLPPQSSPSDLPSPNSIFSPTPSSIPNVEILHPKPLNVSGGEIGWSAVPGHGNWPKVWNGEYNLDGENQRLDHHGFRYRPNVNLAYDSISTTPFLPLPNFVQRSSQPPSPSSMANISTGISSPPVMNFQMEPPSNQNICANNYAPLWSDEEKMIGVKRPYPFSMETPPAPAFHFKFPPNYVSPISSLDELASCSNRSCVSSVDPGIAVLREGGPPRPKPLFEPAFIEAKTREHGGLNGDFLSLGPPAAASPHISVKQKQSFANSGLYRRELSELHPQPSKGGNEENIQSKGASKSTPPPFFSFFPSPKKQIAQVQTPGSNSNGELRESVDLSLKL